MSYVAVIGLGHLGRLIAEQLTLEGCAVLGVDIDSAKVAMVESRVDSTFVADATRRDDLTGLELERMTSVLVAIGRRSLEASIVATALLRELDVSFVVSRAADERHARVLTAVGADQVFLPEAEVAHRLAVRLARPGILDEIRLGEAAVSELVLPVALEGVPVGGLAEESEDVTVLAVRRRGETIVRPDDAEILEEGDVLVLLSKPETLRRLADLL